MKGATMSEELLAYVIERQWRGKGYEVLPLQKLDFLPEFTPDLVVRKDGETRVIEIKTRSSLAASPKIRKWARQIHSRPGWSFELVLVGEPEKLESPESLRSFDVADVLGRIDQAERVLDSGFSEAAFLLAWTACEAAIRMSLVECGASNAGITTSRHILDQAVYLGAISRDEYRHVTVAQKNRNAIAHGFGSGDVTGESVKNLLATARGLLATSDQRANG